jgi:hypothetical protein
MRMKHDFRIAGIKAAFIFPNINLDGIGRKKGSYRRKISIEDIKVE